MALLLAASSWAATQKAYEAVCRDLAKNKHDSTASVCGRCAELYPAAKRCKKLAAKAQPAEGNLLVTLCETSFANGDLAKARDYCGQCLNMDPGSKACSAALKKMPAQPMDNIQEAK